MIDPYTIGEIERFFDGRILIAQRNYDDALAGDKPFAIATFGAVVFSLTNCREHVLALLKEST